MKLEPQSEIGVADLFEGLRKLSITASHKRRLYSREIAFPLKPTLWAVTLSLISILRMICVSTNDLPHENGGDLSGSAIPGNNRAELAVFL